jgi:hypothetical protein
MKIFDNIVNWFSPAKWVLQLYFIHVIVAILIWTFLDYVDQFKSISIGEKFTVLGLLIAYFGLMQNAMQLKKGQDTRDAQILKETFDDISKLAEQIFELDGNKGTRSKKLKAKKWDSQFFNRLELLCFLINQHLFSEKFAKFYYPAIKDYYQGIFLQYANKDDIENPKTYEEFKKCYKKIICEHGQ